MCLFTGAKRAQAEKGVCFGSQVSGDCCLAVHGIKRLWDFQRNKHYCLDVDKGKAKETTFHSPVEILRTVFQCLQYGAVILSN